MSKHSVKKEQVIVSMTSFPPAIEFAYRALKTVLEGSVLPDKVVLYLHLAQFDKTPVPDELLRLAKESPIFEIHDCNVDMKSHTKLIPALREYPDAVIVTVDDDVRYEKDMLKKLLKYHAKYPDHIIAHRVRKIKVGEPYINWKKYHWYKFLHRRDYSAFSNLQTGVGGALYPAHSLRMDMADPALFLELAPTADDIWFWAMAVANGRKVMPVPFGYNRPKDLHKPVGIALKSRNFKGGEDRNAATLKAILERYPEIRERLEHEKER